MKTFSGLILGFTISLLASSCQDLYSGGEGAIFISFQQRSLPSSKSGGVTGSCGFTKSGGGVPETENFLLTVTDSGGSVIYDGPYGSSPEKIIVTPGSYTVSAVSRKFAEPSFDAVQYGDTQVVMVSSGSTASVTLNCRQLNSGICLQADEKFKSLFPKGMLYIKGADGELEYSFNETRTAFFNPGSISVILGSGGMEQTLFTRTLQAQQILNIKVSASVKTASGGISIEVDTAAVRKSEEYTYGAGGGNDVGNAYSVSEARDHAGENGVWVWGYIVGTAANTGKFSFTGPFSKNTNILLGLRSTTSEGAYCLCVELKSGNIREALNLAGNPSNIGKAICIKGDLVSSYYGIPGLKDLTEYQFR